MDINGITLTQQMIASSSGAMLTSLFTTPLDVVKVRLQSQVKGSQKVVCNTYCTGLLDHVCACQTVAVAADHGECTTANPRRVPQPQFKGILDTFVKISRQEGVRSLWAGLPPTLVMTVPATVLYFSTYEQIKHRLQRTKYKDDYALIPIFAGAVSRICAVTVISPIELIRTKLQSEKLSYRYIQKAIAATVRKEGILSLWRGWGPTILRDVPFSCIYWFHYESFKKMVLRRTQTNELPVTWAFISGAAAGTIAGVATLPFDVVKTHRQIELGQMLTLRSPIRTEATHTLALMMNLYRERGISSLFSGVAPRIAKVAPSCAIMISSYEFFKNFFRKKNLAEKKSNDVQTYVSLGGD